jgi:hypothetical protein
MHYSLLRNTIVNFAELDILIKVIIIDWTISLYLSVYSVGKLSRNSFNNCASVQL